MQLRVGVVSIQKNINFHVFVEPSFFLHTVKTRDSDPSDS